MSEQLLQSAQARYQAFVNQGLKLDMTRGKPASEQLDLSSEMMTIVGTGKCLAADGTDCRNYGILDGLPEAKSLFAEYLEVTPQQMLIGGNASLNLMYDAMVRAMLFGVPGSSSPWVRQEKVKWLCPSPGYDRHFGICKDLGIEMVPVPMTESGPDMAIVEALVATDPTIKGIWCVPRYSNPTGITYTAEVVRALASMKTAAPDFRIFWDNAYHVHHLTETPEPLENIMTACEAAGNPDRVYLFGSTSKITFSGAGVSFMAASTANLVEARKHLTMQTIGHDKINQLRHVHFFKDLAGIHAHMRKHAAILKPKFDAVQLVLASELGEKTFRGQAVACWTQPKGGYFVSLDTQPGLAARIVSLADAAGVKLTGAGATFPLNQDPKNQNIRLAPSLPKLDEIRLAMEVVAVCVQVATYEQA